MEIGLISKEKLYPIVIILYDGSKFSYLYSFWVTDDNYDFLINRDGNICCFKNLSNSNKFLEYFEIQASFTDKELDNSLFICNISEVLFQIENLYQVNNAWLLDSINFLLDCLNTISYSNKNEYKKILGDFADHLTFNLNYEDFFIKIHSKEKVLNSLYWLWGLISSKIRVIYFSKTKV